MPNFPKQPLPPHGLGISSFVLGMIGLLLFALPILGAPISGAAALLAVVGVIVGLARGGISELRWSMAGLFLSAAAFSINIAIDRSPREDRLQRRVHSPDAVHGRPYVPPPAPLRS